MTVTSIESRGQPAGMPAHDLATEQAVLGAMMLSEMALAHCLTVLTEKAFLRPAHQIVLGALRSLADQGSAADPITVRGELERTGEITRMGGPLYLHTLMEACPIALNAPLYAARLLDFQGRRDSELLAERIRQLAEAAELSPQERFDAIYAATDDAIGHSGAVVAETVAADELFIEAAERIDAGEVPGTVELPWADMRHLVRRLRPGQLVTVAARPSLGKSAIAHDIARHTAIRQQLTTVLFTMEMDRHEVMSRLIAAEAGVPLKAITDGEVGARDWDRIARAAPRFADCRLIIDDTPQISLAQIRARLRAMKRRDPAQLAIVDYLQLMDGGGGENRQREVSRLVGGLKGIAREFHLPVVMLCQLNRGPEGRHDKRPYLSDARESGAVENDSDIAILIHRPDYYDPLDVRAGEADLIVDKHRNGPRATVTVAFQGEYGRFVDMAPILRLRDRH